MSATATPTAASNAPANITVRSPLNGHEVYSVPQADAATIAQVMERSRRAAAQIAEMPLSQRIAEVGKIKD